MPYRDEWDRAGKIPPELYVKAGKLGILSCLCGWPEDVCSAPRPKGYDGFFGLITMDELSRCGSGGIVWGLIGGFGIGIGPIIHAGSDEMKKNVAKPVIRGEKAICLAVSEPQAGSDVANLTTTAVEDGDYYVVNGIKKWITVSICGFTLCSHTKRVVIGRIVCRLCGHRSANGWCWNGRFIASLD